MAISKQRARNLARKTVKTSDEAASNLSIQEASPSQQETVSQDEYPTVEKVTQDQQIQDSGKVNLDQVEKHVEKHEVDQDEYQDGDEVNRDQQIQDSTKMKDQRKKHDVEVKDVEQIKREIVDDVQVQKAESQQDLSAPNQIPSRPPKHFGQVVTEIDVDEIQEADMDEIDDEDQLSQNNTSSGSESGSRSDSQNSSRSELIDDDEAEAREQLSKLIDQSVRYKDVSPHSKVPEYKEYVKSAHGRPRLFFHDGKPLKTPQGAEVNLDMIKLPEFTTLPDSLKKSFIKCVEKKHKKKAKLSLIRNKNASVKKNFDKHDSDDEDAESESKHKIKRKHSMTSSTQPNKKFKPDIPNFSESYINDMTQLKLDHITKLLTSLHQKLV